MKIWIQLIKVKIMLRFKRILICTVTVLCLLCSGLTVFAESDITEPVDPVITTQEATTPPETQPTTEKPTVPFTFEVEEPDTKAPEKTTESNTKGEEKTTRPSATTPAYTGSHQGGSQQGGSQQGGGSQQSGGNDRPQQTQAPQQTQESTTENKLPEGAFYVYLERNNGTKRLTCIMFGPGLVSTPEEPVREGYIFDGWFSDKELTHPWYFNESIAKKEMTIYARWIAGEKTVVYDIKVEQSEGGKIEVNPSTASAGEPVMVTVTPEEGKRLVIGSLLINGKPTDVLSFIMPEEDVVISATFENIPEKEIVEEKSSAPKIVLIILAALVLVVIVIIIVLKRRPVYGGDIDFDEDAAEDDDSWVDDSITISDGFVSGKKVNEGTEPVFDEEDEDFEEE